LLTSPDSLPRTTHRKTFLSSLANMPSLQDLSTELRQKIYALVVVAPETAKIATFFRSSPPSRGLVEAASIEHNQGTATPSAINDSAIVRVSKQARADALPMLYQHCKFEFQSSRALELFLDQIGNARQHLRNVSITAGGYEHDTCSLFGATERSLAMLTTVTGLQNFVILHFDLCCSVYSPFPARAFDIFVDICSQFLKTLRKFRRATGHKTDLAAMLDIVKIVLPDCAGCLSCAKRGPPQRVSRSRTVRVKHGKGNKLRRCRCKCFEASRNNDQLMEQLKRCLAINLTVE
jgi:hypothetical protein